MPDNVPGVIIPYFPPDAAVYNLICPNAVLSLPIPRYASFEFTCEKLKYSSYFLVSAVVTFLLKIG